MYPLSPILSIDLGGTHCRIALLGPKGLSVERFATPLHPRAFYELVDGYLKKQAQKAQLIGLAFAGTLDPAQGIIYHSANLPGWARVPIRQELEERFNLPVFLGNDANLACYGEARMGGGQGVKNCLMLTLGTGIGAGAMVAGKLLVGAQGLALEAGHLPINFTGPPCGCGQLGHLEAYASGSGIVAVARAMGLKVTQAEEVFALRESNQVAGEVISQAQFALGRGLAGLVHLLDPELILFGGGLSKQWDALIQPACQQMEKELLPPFRGKLKLRPAQLGEEAGLWGAAFFAEDQWKQKQGIKN